jgi:hypothetical protein
MNLAKWLIGQKKTIQIIAHTYAVKWQFLTEILPPGKLDRSDNQEQSMLSNST